MSNFCSLTAEVVRLNPLRFTLAGVPVLEMVLKHHSWREEAGEQRLVECEVLAKFLGDEAPKWQHAENEKVEVTGFLAQLSLRNTRLVLHIQTINLSKG